MKPRAIKKANMQQQEERNQPNNLEPIQPDSRQVGVSNKDTKKTHSPITRAGVWQRRFSMIAAVFCVTLLVSSLLLVLNRAHQSSTGNPGSSQKPIGGAGALLTLHMIDTVTGWALSEHAVLRTTDGGIHWKNVSPPNATLTRNSIAAFSTAFIVWIAIPRAQATSTQVLHTINSGKTWQQSTLQAAFPKQITFSDAQHGWLLAGWRQTGGAAEAVNVFRTTDGGKSWTKVADALFADATPPGHLPYGGQKSGIHFLDASTGWVTGTVLVPGLSWLYITHDGGLSWHQQTLLKPPGIPTAQFTINSPTFFSTTDGILPVIFSDFTTDSRIATDIYVTHDGGQTWQSTALLPGGPGVFDFVDMQHGWASDGSVLYMTSDGGNHWIKLSPNEIFKNISLLDFVSSTIGWAISSTNSMPSSLLKTTDGGRTWTAVAYTVL
jgi:photosystem II stability/assembly factor-like uncharacterized protein